MSTLHLYNVSKTGLEALCLRLQHSTSTSIHTEPFSAVNYLAVRRVLKGCKLVDVSCGHLSCLFSSIIVVVMLTMIEIIVVYAHFVCVVEIFTSFRNNK